MLKIDHKKEMKHLYKPKSSKVEIVNVPEMNFLMINGEGDPNTAPAFSEAVEALFSLSYTLKFMIKKGPQNIDYSVMPLEGLWWADDMNNFSVGNKENWLWTLMIMQPEYITEELIQIAKEKVNSKKDLPGLAKIRFENFNEGKAAQTMHIGPFSEEGPTVARVHKFIKEQNLKLSGKHHEIYLSDIRRAAPDKWKTIIRQPVESYQIA